jgi:hypothetical protein
LVKTLEQKENHININSSTIFTKLPSFSEEVILARSKEMVSTEFAALGDWTRELQSSEIEKIIVLAILAGNRP